MRLNVFPNPTTDFINIESGEAEDYIQEFQIVNQIGQVVHNEKNDGKQNQYKIDLSSWPTGVYFVVVTGKENQRTVKFEKSE